MSNSRPNGVANSRCLSKKVILMALLMLFGLTLLSIGAAIAGETAGEYIDDSVITTEVNAKIIKDPDAH